MQFFLHTLFVTRRTEQEYSFDYFVLVDEARVGDTFLCESYGVQVSAVDAKPPDTCAIPDITTSTQRIDELMELLVTHVVTPSTLRDVVEDWLSA